MDIEQIRNMNREEALKLAKDIIVEKGFCPKELGPWVSENLLTATTVERDAAVRTAKTMWECIVNNMGNDEAERWLQDNLEVEDFEACGIKLRLYSVYTVDFHKEIQVCVPNTYDEDQVYEYVMEELSFDTGDLDYEVCEESCDMIKDDVESCYKYNLENRPSDFDTEDWNL